MESDPALIAVATGGFSGKGLGEGMQAKLGYLPTAVAHNDFIFAVIAEESGLIGGTLASGAILLIVFGCLRVAAKASDRFGAMLAVGVSVLLITHTFINVGMTLGITPITGLPLPFLSYGGSFLIVCFFLLGMVQCLPTPKGCLMNALMQSYELLFGFFNHINHGKKKKA